MKKQFFTLEKKKEEIAKLKQKIGIYEKAVKAMEILRENIAIFDGKRIYKQHIDRLTEHLPDGIELSIYMRKDGWGYNDLRLKLPYGLIRDECFNKLVGDTIIIYPVDDDYGRSEYISNLRVFNGRYFDRSIQRTIEQHIEMVDNMKRAIDEFEKWRRKFNQMAEIYKDIKENAPDFFKYNIPDFRCYSF